MKTLLFIVGLAFLVGASWLALTGPEAQMSGENYIGFMTYPLAAIRVLWRLEIVILALVMGTVLISRSLLASARFSLVILGWAVLYFGFMLWRFLVGYIPLIQFFRFNQAQDYLFLFLLSVYIGLLLAQIFNPAKRYDVLLMGIGFLGLSGLSVTGWWAGPRGFQAGSIPQAIQFACVWLFSIPMIISPLGLIVNVIRNLLAERRVRQDA